MESFFSHLQKSVLDRRRWGTGRNYESPFSTRIEHTSHRRRQVVLGWLTPIEFEAIMTAPASQAA
jgi:putative transposase